MKLNLLITIFLVLLSTKTYSQTTEYIDDNYTLIQKGDNSWGIFDGSSNKWVIERIAAKIEKGYNHSTFSNGLCPVKIQGKWCYINAKGEIVLKTDYDLIYGFSYDGLAEVIKNNKLGFINTKGELVTEIIYDVDNLTFVHRDDSYLFVKRNGLACLINRKGQEIISGKSNYSFIGFSSQTSEAEYFSYFYNDGLCAVQRNKKWGYVNLKGELVIPCEYDEFRPFFKGISPVSKDGKWGVIDKNNKLIIPFMFDDISNYDSFYGHSGFDEDELKQYGYFKSGLCPVAKQVNEDLTWGFINQKGDLVIPFKYNDVEDFNTEGIALVYLNGKPIKINTKGQQVNK